MGPFAWFNTVGGCAVESDHAPNVLIYRSY